jgi:thioesterase domain-containing protein
VAPRTDLERRLSVIWSELLGTADVGITDNFFELGGNSLASMRLKTLIEKQLESEIKLADIFNNPTIKGLIKVITGTASSGVQLNFSDNEDINDKIYFIPPIFGNAMIYQDLAHAVSSSYNSTGLNISGLEKGDAYFDKVEEAAELFSNEIIKDQNSGKIIVFCYSFGSHIGFETVRRLQETYRELELFIVDAAPKDLKMTKKLQKMDYTSNDNTKELMKLYKLHFANEFINEEDLERYLENSKKMFFNYSQQGKVNCDIHAFKSELSSTDVKRWKDYTNGKLRVTQLNGSHWEAIQPSNITLLAKELIKLTKKKTPAF